MSQNKFTRYKIGKKPVTLASIKKLNGGERLYLSEFNFATNKMTRFTFIFSALVAVTGKNKKYYSFDVTGKCKTTNNLPLFFEAKTGRLRSVLSSDISEIYWEKQPIKNSSNKITKAPSKRPSPTESATLFKVGTKKKGNDGNLWEVLKASNGSQRWKKIQLKS